MPVKGCRGSEVDDRHLNGSGRLNHQCWRGPQGLPGGPQGLPGGPPVFYYGTETIKATCQYA